MVLWLTYKVGIKEIFLFAYVILSKLFISYISWSSQLKKNGTNK